MGDSGVVIINFAHPMTDVQLQEVETLTGQAVARVLDVPVQVDLSASLEPQTRELVDRVSLSSQEWQTLPLVINPPGLAPLTAVLVAELHGRLGYFPSLVWIRPVAGAVPRRYEVAGLLDLQTVRDQAREQRAAG